jgi:hypothetical protein
MQEWTGFETAPLRAVPGDIGAAVAERLDREIKHQYSQSD